MKTQIKNRSWLNFQIANLNSWLNRHDKSHPDYRIRRHNRDYYVRRLIELEENNLETVAV